MRVAIMFESRTGNTELIASAIRDEISDYVIYYGEPAFIDADLYVIGSWTDKGACVPPINSLIMGLRDTKIAYFCTAGFGESKEYYSRLVERVEEILDPSSDIVGTFCCQGKMPSSVRDRYVKMLDANPNDGRLLMMIDNYDKASTHPNEQDILNAKSWIRELVDSL